MMLVESSNVWQWRLRELGRGDAHRKPGGIVSEGIWRVLTRHMRTFTIRINGDGESQGHVANPGLLGK